jgi:ketosteroid isomerase-like protein
MICRIAVLGRYTATNSVTGKALDAQFVHVWTVEDGKVTQFQQYTDTAQYTAVSAGP